MRKTHAFHRVVAICLCIMLLPGLAQAATWGEFLNTAQQKMQTAKDSGQSTVTLEASDFDGPITGNGNALTTEDGFTLIINGLTFEGGMVLAGGNFVLEDVEIYNTSGNGIEIKGNPQGSDTVVSLTLDEDCAIDVLGSGILSQFQGWNDAVDIAIYNEAEINAGENGIKLEIQDSAENTVVVENHGDIHASGEIGIQITVSSSQGDAVAILINYGDIDGVSEYGLQAGSYSDDELALSYVENYADISDLNGQSWQDGRGIYSTSTTNTGYADAHLYNEGAISNTYGDALYAQAEAHVHGEASVYVENSGDISGAGGNGIYAFSYAGGDFSDSTVINSGELENINENGIFNVARSADEADASATTQNSGNIHDVDYNGIYTEAATEGNGSAEITLQNSGNIDESYNGIYSYIDSGDATVNLRNDGDVSGDRTGLTLEGPADMDIRLSGNGNYDGGAYTGRASGDQYVDTDVLLFIDYPDSSTMPQGQDLKDDLLRIAEESGLITLQDGTLVLSGYDVDIRTVLTDFSIEMVAPAQNPDWEGAYQLPSWVEEINSLSATEEPEPTPIPDNHPCYQKISYSEEYLWQAWFCGASWNLRLHEILDSADGLLDKGDKQLFKESLCSDGAGGIALTLTARTKIEGTLLCSIDMRTLTRLAHWNITTLTVVNGDVVDAYPVLEILAALEFSGYEDCLEVWLAGMDGDAIILDSQGNKVVL